MIPRGEVGLVFARMGLATGALTAHLYSAVTMMVLVTTFMMPPLLARMAKGARPPAHPGDRRGDGGIDDLVSGADRDKVLPGITHPLERAPHQIPPGEARSVERSDVDMCLPIG
ncbi:MAG: hypothetical protein Q7S20_06975 [Gemmatimonadaceae bacterium]|nr:hypothetical protein [Gemmatimonadaceae bacterium]